MPSNWFGPPIEQSTAAPSSLNPIHANPTYSHLLAPSSNPASGGRPVAANGSPGNMDREEVWEMCVQMGDMLRDKYPGMWY